MYVWSAIVIVYLDSAWFQVIYSSSYTDDNTISAIKEVNAKYNYTIDPHGAVGYLALRDYLKNISKNSFYGIIVETAHPAKFKDIVESATCKEINMPESLSNCLEKEKRAVALPNEYKSLKNYLLSIA